MQGILVCNHFLKSEKFETLHRHYAACAAKRGHTLQVCTNLELACTSDSAIRTDYVLFLDKDVVLARRLEKLGLPVFNSSRAIALCDDKAKTYTELLGHVPQPETLAAPLTFFASDYSEFVDYAAEKLSLPLVFKACCGSFGAQVFLCKTKEEIYAHIEPGVPFLLQRFVASSAGHDVRIEVIGGRAVCKMARQNAADFRANLTNGGVAVPAAITPAERETAEKCAAVLGCDFCGVDLFADGSVCEVNSNAHVMNLLDATGVDCADLILQYIEGKIQCRES
ncbi:MAG: RimK family alpha-L-glutamate ligase [Clostridiales bacterium]|nr:RimK family alpha-L-glutamate ligase [Clostridiales bacterium]